MPNVQMGWRQYAVRAGAVGLAALSLCWPAIYNGYPMLFPDSLGYLAMGHGVTMKLRGLVTPEALYASSRSEIYEAGLFLLHGRGPLWPVVIFQALLTAWVIWLVVRSLSQRPVVTYLVLMAVVSSTTSAGWFVSFMTPDVLGPVLFLSVYLLLFVPEMLSRWERVALMVVAWWSLASHSAHLLLTAGLCVVFGALWLLRWSPMRRRGGWLLVVAGLVLLAAGSQMAVHKRLYGRASLAGNPNAYMMARLLGDGPARLYLQQHCDTLHWEICKHVDHLPTTEEGFLWNSWSIWGAATDEERARLRSEEMPLLMATLRNYPREQAARTWANFLNVLITVGPWDFFDAGGFSPEGLDYAMPGLSAVYPHTRQSHNGMPQVFFRAVQRVVLPVSALLSLLLLPWCWRRGQTRLLALAVVVWFVVLVNAFVTGAISGVYSRLQDRIAWLMVLLAVLMVHAWWADRRGLGTSSDG
jgi:uncharacterized protein YceK